MRHETLTREEVDDLIKDWFQRDGDAFVHTGTVDRVGWESTLDAGESYSAYLIEAPTLSDLIRRAYPLANDMLVAMNLPKKVHVKIHNGGTHCTDLNTSRRTFSTTRSCPSVRSWTYSSALPYTKDATYCILRHSMR